MVGAQINKVSLQLRDSGFFVLRTPLLPVEELVGWSQGLLASQCLSSEKTARFKEAWEQDILILRTRLRQFVQRPEIRQALFVASPSLDTSLKYWLENPDSKKGLQAERSLVRYFARMAGRPMPFGLFSGSSVGLISEGNTHLELSPRNCYRGDCRLDMDYVTSLTFKMRNDPDVAREVRYWPNTSLRKVGSYWHYVEGRVSEDRRSHHLVRLDADDYLDAAIRRASNGSDYEGLVAAVLHQAVGESISHEEASDFVLDLVRNEVLVSNLAPPITGNQPLDDVIDTLDNVPSAANTRNVLISVREQLAEVSKQSIGLSVDEYRKIETALNALPVKTDPARLLQVDMAKPVRRATLSPRVIGEIVQSAELMARIAQTNEWPEIRTFKEAFLGRYEHATVSLMEVLDDEVGIGFGRPTQDNSPLLKGLALVNNPSSSPDVRGELLRKLDRTNDFKEELSIDVAELPALEDGLSKLASALFVHAVLVAPTIEEVNAGNYTIVFRGWAGPSGARLFGRFCHWDSQLCELVKRHLREEEATDSDAVFAEVVHFPEGRIGNVLCRPVLRDYEIVYLAKSGAPPDRQIPVSDLLVSVDTQSRIRLYSKRLGRRVIPRLTNAHGYFNSTLSPVYRFLCYLQHEDSAMPAFSWGQGESFDFLPRLRVGKTILSVARWLLKKDDIKKITASKGPRAFEAVQNLRRERHLPRWILLVQGDQSLPFDLDNALGVEALLHVLKRAEEAKIEEMYPGPEDLCVTGPEGHFFHELLIPFISRNPAAEAQQSKPKAPKANGFPLAMVSESEGRGFRIFPPGESWLYYKIYGGIATLDDILASQLPEVVRTAFERQLASRWFFVRYNDPDHHLRIRFDTRSEPCFHELFSLLSNAFNPALRNGRIWKLQVDTYQREIERYGGLAGMFLSEDVFHADSDAVLRMLSALRGDESIRWKLALLGVHTLFDNFNINLVDRKTMVRQWCDGLGRELGSGPSTKRQLAEKFRTERPQLESLLKFASSDELTTFGGLVLKDRSARLRILADQFRVLVKTKELQSSLSEVIGSFSHMHINRLLRSNQRAQEMVIYDFLAKLYEGRVAVQEAQVGSMAIA